MRHQLRRYRDVPRWAGSLSLVLLAACATTSPEPIPPAEPPPPGPSAAAPPGPAVPRSVARAPLPRSVQSVLETIGPAAEDRIVARFNASGVDYPPHRVHLVAFKDEGQLELWATAAEGRRPRRAATFPLLARSGSPGPKLREGDFQIPEGIYRVTWLHPNSQYHLSMKLDYPNEFDRAQARREGRTNLGGEIFLHGRNESVGCLAVGDPVIEELFVLAARVGIERVTTIIVPWDLRRRDPPDLGVEGPWWSAFYENLRQELAKFR